MLKAFHPRDRSQSPTTSSPPPSPATPQDSCPKLRSYSLQSFNSQSPFLWFHLSNAIHNQPKGVVLLESTLSIFPLRKKTNNRCLFPTSKIVVVPPTCILSISPLCSLSPTCGPVSTCRPHATLPECVTEQMSESDLLQRGSVGPPPSSQICLGVSVSSGPRGSCVLCALKRGSCVVEDCTSQCYHD